MNFFAICLALALCSVRVRGFGGDNGCDNSQCDQYDSDCQESTCSPTIWAANQTIFCVNNNGSFDGDRCDDNNDNTYGDQCSNGVCVGTASKCLNVQCHFTVPDAYPTAVENCMEGGDCDEDTGKCSGYLPNLIGFGCDDGKSQTFNDKCNDKGECIGSTDACYDGVCGVDEFNPCAIQSKCHTSTNTSDCGDQGMCAVCTAVTLPDGHDCDDRTGYTHNTKCQGGVCTSWTFDSCAQEDDRVELKYLKPILEPFGPNPAKLVDDNGDNRSYTTYRLYVSLGNTSLKGATKWGITAMYGINSQPMNVPPVYRTDFDSGIGGMTQSEFKAKADEIGLEAGHNSFMTLGIVNRDYTSPEASNIASLVNNMELTTWDSTTNMECDGGSRRNEHSEEAGEEMTGLFVNTEDDPTADDPELVPKWFPVGETKDSRIILAQLTVAEGTATDFIVNLQGTTDNGIKWEERALRFDIDGNMATRSLCAKSAPIQQS